MKTFIFVDGKIIYAVVATCKKDAIRTMNGRGVKFLYEDHSLSVNPTVCITTENAQLAIRKRNEILFS